MSLQDAVIVAAARTAVGKAKRGGLSTVRPDEMAAAVIQDLLRRAPALDPAEVEDVVLGCSFPEAEQGLNMARTVALRAGLPETSSGETINRYCASGSQAIAHVAYAIMAGQLDVAIAGGAESMSMVPMTGNKFAPNAYFAAREPGVYTNMGLTAENVAEKYDISRTDQDAFAFHSHQKALAALASGVFTPEIVPLEVETLDFLDGAPHSRRFTVNQDEGPRAETTLEVLARLKPVFKEGGTVTAGNSSQTSDGAAALLLMSGRKAASLGLRPLARFVAFATGGVPAELMGIGPIAAVPKALKIAGLKQNELDLIELNEAFASQSLAVMRALNLDQEKVNVHGGAIALGHPLGCTGGKLTVQLLNEMQRRSCRYGMVTMCVGGGMGAASIFENLS